uniref:Uncharacterized protein n=1 Tax=viral metagenome TaxID=1070528 RepID=A0A6H1Z7E5_9ZZZZ
MAYTHLEDVSYINKFAKGSSGSEVEIRPVSGVADGYKIARGESSITGSLSIATGLTTVVQAVACLSTAPALNGTLVAVISVNGGNITVGVYKPTSAADGTPILATVSRVIRWIAIGT